MNHQKIYEAIIKRAKNENRIKHKGVYFENHHILPKCLGGSDDESNRVLLTAREHFLSHKLLMYSHKKNKKLAFAYCMLAFNKKKERKISSREYEYAKETRKIRMSEKTKEKIRKTAIDKKIIKHLIDFNNKHGVWNKGKIGLYSKEYLNKLRVPNSETQNKNVSKAMQTMPKITCPHCKKVMSNSNGAYTLYHGYKCKLNPVKIM